MHLTVDAKGARIMRDISRENIGKRMAILLFEKGKGVSEVQPDAVVKAKAKEKQTAESTQMRKMPKRE